MIKHLYLFSTLLLTTLLCHAMENIPEAKIIMELTTIKEPQSVICLSDNIVAILGKDGCNLTDFSTNIEIKKLDSYTCSTPFQSINAHPNKKTLAIQRLDNLKIYDVATKSKILNKTGDWQCPPIFNSIDETILINNYGSSLNIINYKKNHNCSSYPEKSIPIACHPTKQEFILSSNNSINLVQLNNNNLIIKKSVSMASRDCKYSPDGSLIAINCPGYGCSILDPESGSHDMLINDNKPLWGMVFHPTSFILAAFNRLTKGIYYWNAKTRQLIATISLVSNNDSFCPNSFSQRLDFSCDGTKLIIALPDKCLVLQVPFEVLYGEPYTLGTKDKCVSALCALNHYICAKNMLPQDLTHFLVYNLLAASKYSLTNY